MKTNISVVTALSLLLGAAAPATAQMFGEFGDVLLVTPDGRILDYVPEAGEVDVVYDRRGRRVLLDHYGNVVATEVPANQGGRELLGRVEPGGPDYGWSNRSPSMVERRALDAPRQRFGEPRYNGQRGWRDGDDVTTGTVPDNRGFPPAPRDPEQLDAAKPDSNSRRPDPKPNGNAGSGKSLSKSSVTALQVLLDRTGASPGVIDGRMGSNVRKALSAYEQITGERLDPADTDAILAKLSLDGGMPVTRYTITAEDAAGPYVASIPSDYAHKAELPSLAYTSPAEKLAEKFHLDEDYLRALNPGVNFSVPGTIIKVVDTGADKKAKVARIVADKASEQVRGYDRRGRLVVAYPATIGSSDTPSPSGTVTVERIAPNPEYTYNPKINFKQGENDKILRIPPGPNGPVGSMWIALSKPTYGIHGTPEPARIGKTNSHGCVRLTNWDAAELASMIEPGVTVEFLD